MAERLPVGVDVGLSFLPDGAGPLPRHPRPSSAKAPHPVTARPPSAALHNHPGLNFVRLGQALVWQKLLKRMREQGCAFASPWLTASTATPRTQGRLHGHLFAMSLYIWMIEFLLKNPPLWGQVPGSGVAV